MAIGTLAEYKVLARIPSGNTTDDARIQAMLDLTESFILGVLGASLSAATYTAEVYDGTGTDVLLLKAYPVASVASVVQVYDDGSTQTLDADSYRVADGGRLCLLGAMEGRWATYWGLSWAAAWPTQWGVRPCFTQGYANFRVTYTTLAATDLGALKLAQYAMVDELRGTSGQDLTKTQEAIGQYSYSRGGGVSTMTGDAARDARWTASLRRFQRGTCPV